VARGQVSGVAIQVMITNESRGTSDPSSFVISAIITNFSDAMRRCISIIGFLDQASSGLTQQFFTNYYAIIALFVLLFLFLQASGSLQQGRHQPTGQKRRLLFTQTWYPKIQKINHHS
jgi:hypothetical protein